ncbi:MAG: Crp/Fnr family transcriptional regulator [Thermoanaerobaculia bacterium]
MSSLVCNECLVRGTFCRLPEDLRAVFEPLKTTATYRKGDVAFHESDSCHSVFAVCAGSVKLITSASQGKVLLLRFARAGELLGMAEAVTGRVYDYSGIAAEPAILARIPRDRFMRFVSSFPAAACRLTVALSEQYRFAQRETKFLAFGETSTARLARLLLDWSAERGSPSPGGMQIESHLTHAELAESIGSTRETVTRILGALSHDGIVERTHDAIVIHREQELNRLAAF